MGAVKAQEPYQEVEGRLYSKQTHPRVTQFPWVKNERDLRFLAKLLDEAEEAYLNEKPRSPALDRKLKSLGVPLEDLLGGYVLSVTDATGAEYDVFEDLGIQTR